MTKVEEQRKWERLHECPFCGSDECEVLIYDWEKRLVGCDKCTTTKLIDDYAEEHFNEV